MPSNFDTIEFMDTLIEGGFSEKQARALSQAMYQLVESHLVSRDYLDVRLAQLKVEMVQWMVGAMIVQAGLILGVVKLMLP